MCYHSAKATNYINIHTCLWKIRVSFVKLSESNNHYQQREKTQSFLKKKQTPMPILAYLIITYWWADATHFEWQWSNDIIHYLGPCRRQNAPLTCFKSHTIQSILELRLFCLVAMKKKKKKTGSSEFEQQLDLKSPLRQLNNDMPFTSS